MTLHQRPLAPCHAALLVGSLALALAIPAQAQQTAPSAPDASAVSASVGDLPFEIGHATKSGAVYTITATQPATSKLVGQKVCIKVVDTTGTSTTTRYYAVATGKFKTVAQLDTILSEIFGRFLSSPAPAAPNQEIGKIGDVKHGGEVHFFADPSNRLRLDSLHPGEPTHTSYYSRADVEALQAALTGQPPA